MAAQEGQWAAYLRTREALAGKHTTAPRKLDVGLRSGTSEHSPPVSTAEPGYSAPASDSEAGKVSQTVGYSRVLGTSA